MNFQLKGILIFLIGIFFLVSSCRTKPEIKPIEVNKSSVIVFEFVDKRNLNLFGAGSFNEVWLLRVDDKANSYSNMELIQSNYQSIRSIYFLNIKPGQYVIAGATSAANLPDGKKFKDWIVFDKESREKSKFIVKPGELTLHGQYVGNNSIEATKDTDPELVQIGLKIFPGFANAWSTKPVDTSGTYDRFPITNISLIGKFIYENKSPEKIEEIKSNAKKDLADTEWSYLIK